MLRAAESEAAWTSSAWHGKPAPDACKSGLRRFFLDGSYLFHAAFMPAAGKWGEKPFLHNG
jgi:hypothetical protein